jgi:multicomponent Na+:H+ antiporter subunit B
VVILLREDDAGMTRAAQADVVRSDAIRFFGVPMLGLVVLVGLWLAAFGLVTPGGGFQGGVAIAAGIAVLYLTVGYRAWHRLAHEHLLDPFERVGAGAYVSVGIAALVAGAPFLHNLFGPGQPGTLFSGGSMSILNWGVAIEVAAANLVLYTEFLQRLVAPRELHR